MVLDGGMRRRSLRGISESRINEQCVPIEMESPARDDPRPLALRRVGTQRELAAGCVDVFPRAGWSIGAELPCARDLSTLRESNHEYSQ